MQDVTGAILPRASLALFMLIVGVSAQGQRITFKEFNSYIQTSRELTKDIPFRTSVKVTTGRSLTGREWIPYSSWVTEAVYPDRSRLTYKTPTQREFVRIGKDLYSRSGPNAQWDLSADKGWAPIPSNPAGWFAFSQEAEVSLAANSGKAATITIVTKSSAETDEKHTKITRFVFNEEGTLVQRESIAHNGFDFVRQVTDYEYDPDIKIEAPIK